MRGRDSRLENLQNEKLRELFFTQYYYCIEVKQEKVGGVCRTGTGEEKLISIYTVLIGRVWKMYEGWNFNFGITAVTFDTAHLQISYFHRPSMYSPKLCITRSQRRGSRMMPLAAPVLLMVRTERSTTAEGLTPPCNCPIR